MTGVESLDRQFSWSGVSPGDSTSMHIVNSENIRALEEMTWTRVDNEVDADVAFSFFHQGPSAPDCSPHACVFYLCTTSHNAIVSRYVPCYRAVASTDGNLIFVLNDAMRGAFAEAGVPTRVWNHGVDRDQFHPGPRPDGPLTFGFLGQSAPFKRARFLYQVFLNAFGPDDRDVRLVMVTGPELARELAGRAPNVVVRPGVERRHVADYYRSLDCFVTFSYCEGYNMPPLEALACGIPCIVTDSPEMHEPPYDRLCTHVAARRVLRPEVQLDTHFAPAAPAAYFSPPWVHEVSMDDAVEALRSFKENPIPRRSTLLPPEFSWRGRIETQVLPYLPDPLGPNGSNPEFRRLWRDHQLPAWRARPLCRTEHWTLQISDGRLLLIRDGRASGLRCNEVAAAVWQLCDGRRRFVDIVYELQCNVDGVPREIVTDVENAVSTLLQYGAVGFVSDRGSGDHGATD